MSKTKKEKEMERHYRLMGFPEKEVKERTREELNWKTVRC